MKSLFKYICCIAAFLPLAACVGSEEPAGPLRTRVEGIDVEFDLDPSASDNGVLDDYFIDGRSVILISQRGDHLSIDFNESAVDSEGNEIPNGNLYKYVYYYNSAANWEDYYNFQPYGNRALDWAFIANDRLNGEYALGALYYPVEYNIYNSVETDQSSYENLLRSNVLGAWHRINAVKTRLRFRFNHLMEAMRVTLLIPDWDPADNSGFGPDAAASGTLLGVIKDFYIDWPLNNSTELPPNAQFIAGGEPCDILMYLESVVNEPETVNFNKITSSFPDVEERVRKATFVVLFPPQQPATTAMRFVLKTMGGMEKNYVWNTNNMYDGTLDSKGGRVNNIVLYLPRKNVDAILIKAHIMDWIEAESEFTVIPDDAD